MNVVEFKRYGVIMEAFFDAEFLTTKQLLELGLTPLGLESLVKNGDIERVQEDCYVPCNSSDFLIYYDRLKNKKGPKDYQKMSQCIKMCYRRWPNDIGVCKKYLYDMAIQGHFSSDIGSVLDVLDSVGDPDFKINFNRNLILLNEVAELPEKYRDRINHFQLSDIKLAPVDESADISDHIFARNFYMAYLRSTADDSLSRHLLDCIRVRNTRIYRDIVSLIRTKNYDRLSFYFNKYSRYTLDPKDYRILAIAKDYVTAKRTGVIPQPISSDYEIHDFNALIRNKDYGKALEMIRKYRNQIHGEILETETALCDINELFNRIRQTDQQLSNNTTLKFVLPTLMEKVNMKIDELMSYKGLAIFEAEDGYDFEQISKVVRERNDASFASGHCEGIQEFYLDKLRSALVVRYRNYSPECVDIRQMVEKANDAQRGSDLFSARNLFCDATSRLDMPNSYLYSKMAKCFLKTGHTQMALDTYRVAQVMAEKNPKDQYDYGAIISQIRVKEQLKREKIFEPANAIFNAAAPLILDGSVDFNVATDNLALRPKFLLKLMLAREYYKRENYYMGDNLVNDVYGGMQSIEDYSGNYVMGLLEEVVTNRENYRLQGRQFVKVGNADKKE